MSDDRFDDPFVSPASTGPQSTGPQSTEWQGTPVPPSTYWAPQQPNPGYAQAPPPPGAHAGAVPAEYPAADRPDGTYYPAATADESPATAAANASPPHTSTAIPLPPHQVPPGDPHQPPPAQYPAASALAYPPPPPTDYGYAPTYAANTTPKNWMGITSLILSLVTPIFVITAIPGVIFGHLGLAACKRGEANNRGLALAGVIVGWIMIGFGFLFVGLIIMLSISDSTSGY